MFVKLHSHLIPSLLLVALAASAGMLACSGNPSQNAHAGGPPAMPVKVQEAPREVTETASGKKRILPLRFPIFPQAA